LCFVLFPSHIGVDIRFWAFHTLGNERPVAEKRQRSGKKRPSVSLRGEFQGCIGGVARVIGIEPALALVLVLDRRCPME